MDVTQQDDAHAAMGSMLTAPRVAICCLALIATTPERVRADAQTSVALVWNAPAECPSRAEVLTRIDAQLGERAASAGAVEAEATVTRGEDGRYALVLELEGADGHARRELGASSCDAVVQAAALLLAMAADAAGGASTAATTTTITTTTETATATATAKRGAAWGLAVLTVLDLSSMPGAGFGLLGEAEAQLGLWRFGLGAELFLPAEGRASQVPTATVDVSAIMARGTLCPTWSLGPDVELGPCGFGEIGRSSGEAHGIRKPVAGSALWLAAGALVQARFGLGARFSLTGEAGAAFPGTRQRFLVLTDTGTVAVHRAAAVSPRFSLGISYVFE